MLTIMHFECNFARIKPAQWITSNNLTASPPFIEDMLFYCQQPAEKTMKGFLNAHDRIFRKTHDLDELASATMKVVMLFLLIPALWYNYRKGSAMFISIRIFRLFTANPKPS